MSLTARGTIGTVADVGSIVAILGNLAFVFVGGNPPATLLAIALAGLAYLFIGLNFRLQHRLAAESRRARSGPVLVRVQANLTAADVFMEDEDVTGLAKSFQRAASELAHAFGIATGRACRVSVQDLVLPRSGDAAEGHVTTLCRDVEPLANSREDNLPDVAEIKGNTDFLRILNGAPHFFCNDLSALGGYKNSHFEWPLEKEDYPYRSTIVWPIVGPMSERHQTPGAPVKTSIIGFLCVDSATPGTFDAALDVSTGAAVANAMYSPLRRFRTWREQQPSPS